MGTTVVVVSAQTSEQPVDRQRQDVSRLIVGLLSDGLDLLVGATERFVAYLFLHLLQYYLTRFHTAQLSDVLQVLQPLGFEGVYVPGPLFLFLFFAQQGTFTTLVAFLLTIERLLLLTDTPLLAKHFLAPVAQFLLALGANAKRLLFGLEENGFFGGTRFLYERLSALRVAANSRLVAAREGKSQRQRPGPAKRCWPII
jgi:hypothetical protein